MLKDTNITGPRKTFGFDGIPVSEGFHCVCIYISPAFETYYSSTLTVVTVTVTQNGFSFKYTGKCNNEVGRRQNVGILLHNHFPCIYFLPLLTKMNTTTTNNKNNNNNNDVDEEYGYDDDDDNNNNNNNNNNSGVGRCEKVRGNLCTFDTKPNINELHLDIWLFTNIHLCQFIEIVHKIINFYMKNAK